MQRRVNLALGVMWGAGALLVLLWLLASTPHAQTVAVAAPAAEARPLVLSRVAAHSTLYAAGDHAVITQSLVLTGTHRLTRPLTIRGSLTLSGVFTVTEALTVTERLSVTGRLLALKRLTVAPRLVKPGRVYPANYLVQKTATVTQGLQVAGNLMVTGTLTVTGGLAITGETHLSGALFVLGRQTAFAHYLPLVLKPANNNGSFEDGMLLWSEFSTKQQPLIRPASTLGVAPHSGWWAAQLGTVNDEVALISQGVTVSQGQSCLVYWQWVQSRDTCRADYGGVGIDGKWHTVYDLCAGTATARWLERTVDLRTLVSKTNTFVLNFAVANDYSLPSILYIDDVAFRADAYCEVRKADAAPAAAPLTALVGQPIELHLPLLPKE